MGRQKYNIFPKYKICCLDILMKYLFIRLKGFFLYKRSLGSFFFLYLTYFTWHQTFFALYSTPSFDLITPSFDLIMPSTWCRPRRCHVKCTFFLELDKRKRKPLQILSFTFELCLSFRLHLTPSLSRTRSLVCVAAIFKIADAIKWRHLAGTRQHLYVN